ncbi:MAG TPA: PAS domain S-box protein [Caulobacteraceae bacterium]|jgi:PAS domain S-box-containing protein|nr:PAS domain S-box protein [Caulobacteraceae bacterium]
MGELADVLAPVSPDTPGEALYQRFASEPETLVVAVVDANSRPIGLVGRQAYSMSLASGSKRGARVLGPVSKVMDPTPRIVEAAVPADQFADEMLAGSPADLPKGFVVVEDGRYLGVGAAATLLRAVRDGAVQQAERAQVLSRELVQARVEAQSREDTFHLLFDTNPVAMCIWDLQTLKIVAVNAAALRQYGYDREETLRLSITDFMPEAERARLAKLQREGVMIDNGDSWRHVRADGALLDVVLMARVTEYEGRPARLGAFFDITKRKRAEEELQRTRSFLDAVVDNVPQMLVVKEMRDNRIVLLNKAGEKLLGVSRDQVVGKSEYDLFPHDQAEILVARDREAVASGVMQVIPEEYIQTVDQGVRILETKKLAVHAHRDEPPFLLVVSQDITEQKRDAEELARARDEAEAANLAKSEFLANMSHEIRTPLNGVLGIAGVLSKTRLDEQQREMVHIIENSAVALNALLSDILDIARVEAGHLTVSTEPFPLADTVREVVDLFRLAAQSKALSLEAAIDPRAEGMFAGDSARIKQILVNLVANAVKFTETGYVRVAVGPDPGDPSQWLFEVQDTGVGFSMEHKAALFGRFNQADGSITRRFGGSGLGLAISNSLVGLMGGALDADSTPGVGSVFRLRLPLQPVGPVEAKPVAHPEPTAQSDTPEILRVLVADDHATNRRVVEMIMAIAGAELVSVENGALAVEAFRNNRFDVVLMDMQMPVMDGLTAIREIRKFEAAQRLPRTPIIALTANAMAEHVTQCLGAGADRHIAKPILPADLLDGVSSVLDEYEAAAEAKRAMH